MMATQTRDKYETNNQVLEVSNAEINVFVHVPVHGALKKIEFAYDTSVDSPDTLAREMALEFGLDEEYTLSIRREIAEQVFRASSKGSPSRSPSVKQQHQQQSVVVISPPSSSRAKTVYSPGSKSIASPPSTQSSPPNSGIHSIATLQNMKLPSTAAAHQQNTPANLSTMTPSNASTGPVSVVVVDNQTSSKQTSKPTSQNAGGNSRTTGMKVVNSDTAMQNPGLPHSLSYQRIAAQSATNPPQKGAGLTSPSMRARDLSVSSETGNVSTISGATTSTSASNAKHNTKYFAACMALLDASAKGNLKQVKAKLAQGAVATYADYDKRTPLHLACTEGHAEIALVLIENGADIEAKDRWGSTPMKDAVKYNHKRIVELLEDHGVEVEVSEEEVMAMELLEFSSRGLTDLVRERLMAGVSARYKDYDDRTALHLAASEGHAAVAELLLLNGAKLDACDRYHRTPIDDATNNGHRNVLQVFREFGAEIPSFAVHLVAAERQSLGMSLIEHSSRGRVDLVRQLIDEGAPVSLGDYDRRTALHLAVAERHLAVVSLLLERGADPMVRDRWGRTPLDEAESSGNDTLKAVLHAAVENLKKKSVSQGSTGSTSPHAENNWRNSG
uniref:Non-specific serine/threonine protein kinase n=1 Tax=Timspurckia oligopyrenoides TaxID=708627 RepID=A0A7S0ZBF5_9RHOD|mmetsp:Transcript_11221/g.20273  ORF Transcript_11221/g.20273 Transcript_11221/m.20273 type:complete len:616 (+) Transcript_11221:225-2072(+)